jgi:hypothetical protein
MSIADRMRALGWVVSEDDAALADENAARHLHGELAS